VKATKSKTVMAVVKAPKKALPAKMAERKELSEKNNEIIVERNFNEKFEEDYSVYALSIIFGRAIPTIEDGFKPVTRRIAYTFATASPEVNKFRKGNYFVGICNALYHPHGDLSLYESIVLLSQEFFIPNPLIDKQGNNGSIKDPKSYAASRYVEFKMSKFAREVLFSDFIEATADMLPNSDKTTFEPKYLPSKIPMLFCVGNIGIGAGYNNSIPTHNLKEVCDATIAFIKNPNMTVLELTRIMKGPDYASRGLITNAAEMSSIYEKGQGVIQVQGRAEETQYKGKAVLAITEIPSITSLSAIMEQISIKCKPDKETKKDGPLQNYIADILDASGIGIENMCLYIIPKPDVSLPVLKNLLLEHTTLKSFEKYQANVLYGGKFYSNCPITTIFEKWIEFRKSTIRRKISYQISVKREDQFIINALIKAHNNLDVIIKLLRSSKGGKEEAKQILVAKYNFSYKEADYIVSQPLYKISNLEINNLKQELINIDSEINNLLDIIKSDENITALMIEDIESVSKKYGVPRQTTLTNINSKIVMTDLIEEKNLLITITTDGFVYSTNIADMAENSRGNKGARLSDIKKGKIIDKSIIINNHTKLFCFSSKGKLFILDAYQLDVDNVHINNILGGLKSDHITSFLPISDDDQGSFILVAESSTIKKVKIEEFRSLQRVHSTGILAMNTTENDDSIVSVVHSVDDDDVVLIGTTRGYVSKMKASLLKPALRQSKGRPCIKFKEPATEKVVSMNIIRSEEEANSCLLMITENGKGKLTLISELIYKRKEIGAGSAHKAIEVNPGDKLLRNQIVRSNEDVIINTKAAKTIRIKSSDINVYSRTAKGNKLIKLNEGDKVSAINVIDMDFIQETTE
jgi:DNA gyrase subunit A